MKKSEQRTRKSGRLGRAAWIWLAFAWGVATLGGYLFLDPIVSRWLWDHPIAWHNNVWVDAFRQLGRAGVPICLMAVWSCVTDKWRPTIIVIVAMILVGLTVCPLKALTRRARPRQVLPATFGQSLPEIRWQKKASFPSGDTAVAFAGATALSLSWGRLWTPALFAAATAIAVLRVTAFAHYPSDVMAGVMIGILCGVAAVRWTVRRWSPEQFRVEGRWRLAAALVIICVLPFVGPYIGMSSSLRIFLKRFALPLIAVALAWLVALRLRARKPEAKKR